MIPQYDFKVAEVEDVQVNSLTYKIDFNSKRVYSKCDGLEALKQAIYKVLSTERFENVIYNDSYGVEIKRFIGKDVDFIKSDLQRTISEAISTDDRVISIDNFTIVNSDLESLSISFEVQTIYGSLTIDSEVKI